MLRATKKVQLGAIIMLSSIAGALLSINPASASVSPSCAPVSGNYAQYFVAVTLTNNQGSATPANFAQLVKMSPITFSSIYAANLDNANWQDGAGNILNSWLESGESKVSTATNYWVNLGANTIAGGGGTLTIYQCIYKTSVNAIDGVATGAEPNYTGTYGQYDNGATVFSKFYDNFAGSSLNGSLWSSEGSFTVSNGLSIATSSSGAPCGENDVYSNSTFGPGVIGEALGLTKNPLSSGQTACVMGGEGFAGGTIDGTPAITDGWVQDGVNAYGLSVFDGASVDYEADSPAASSSVNSIVGVGFVDSSTTQSFVNYVQAASSSFSTSSGALNFVIGFQNNNFITNNYIWARVRDYPPGGEMPPETTIASPSTSVTTASVSSSSGTASMIYPATAWGDTATNTLTIKSTGTAPLYVSPAGTSDTEFAVTGNTCPASGVGVAPGSTCTVTVHFTPNHIGNPINATLTLNMNTSAGSLAVALSGTGVTDLALAPPAGGGLIFGQLAWNTPQTLNVTVENFRTTAVTLTGSMTFTGTNPGDFSIVAPISGTACGATAPAGSGASPSKCNIGVKFTPGALGTESATLNVAGSPTVPSGAATLGITTGATIPATVNPPVEVIYGSMSVSRSQKQTKSITITNLATVPISIGPNSITSGAAFYHISGGTCGSTLAGGQSCTVNVTFAPTTVKTPANGTIKIQDGVDPKSPRTIALSGNGVL
ncbi:MAG TPA: choice-of-anchor D domain-containing protein [Candidatus Binataceae bacterium]|nr:choice-of-anchor D domain-containing protein [Candidatus Binataceae bacterium]